MFPPTTLYMYTRQNKKRKGIVHNNFIKVSIHLYSFKNISLRHVLHIFLNQVSKLCTRKFAVKHVDQMLKKVQVGNDQEKAQSEKLHKDYTIFHSLYNDCCRCMESLKVASYLADFDTRWPHEYEIFNFARFSSRIW